MGRSGRANVPIPRVGPIFPALTGAWAALGHGERGVRHGRQQCEGFASSVNYSAMPGRSVSSCAARHSTFGHGEEPQGTVDVTSAFPQCDLLVLVTPWLPSR